MDDKFEFVCEECGKVHCVYDTRYRLNGEGMCKNRFDSIDLSNKPYFTQHIPNFVDGATADVFHFTDEQDFYNQIRNKATDNLILAKGKNDENVILVQSLEKSWWWVLGFIHNFDMSKLGIPTVNYDVYAKDETVLPDKLNEWLKGKTIIKAE